MVSNILNFRDGGSSVFITEQLSCMLTYLEQEKLQLGSFGRGNPRSNGIESFLWIKRREVNVSSAYPVSQSMKSWTWLNCKCWFCTFGTPKESDGIIWSHRQIYKEHLTRKFRRLVMSILYWFALFLNTCMQHENFVARTRSHHAYCQTTHFKEPYHPFLVEFIAEFIFFLTIMRVMLSLDCRKSTY